MKLNELKSETERLEKGCGKEFITNLGRGGKNICGEIKYLCPTCQAKVEYLKKGISACEEMLKLKDEWKSEWELEFKSIYTKRLQKEIKQALSQRNQEILEIIERMMNKKEDETDVQIWGEELKSKLQEGNKQ